MKVKVVMKVVVMVAMKVVDEVSDENGEWLILSCLTGFEMDKRTEICDCRVAFVTENLSYGPSDTPTRLFNQLSLHLGLVFNDYIIMWKL